MSKIRIADKNIEINEQGYLSHLNDWSEAYAKSTAQRDKIKLFNDHWEIIYYFREYYKQNLVSPTMHQMITNLMSKNIKFHDKKKYEEIVRRFYLKNCRFILLMSEYQIKYRYYTKVIESIKEKSFSGMDNKEFLKLFQKE